MKITTESGTVHLYLEGEMTISAAADLKENLLQSLEKGNSIEINMEGVAKMDLACMQLLCSVHRTAVIEMVILAVTGLDRPDLKQTRTLAGFFFHKSCRFSLSEDDCLWIGGRPQ